MISRRGFTLIEVMIALVIGSVVVLLAYSTLRAGLDVEDRVADARDADASTTAFRAVLVDAIRHAVVGDARDLRGLYTVADASGHATRLSFVSRGITAPLGGSGAWQIALRDDTAGVTLDATSLDSARVPLRVIARGTRRFNVRFLAADDSTWRSGWQDATRLPIAIEVRLLDRDGRDTMAALVARTAPVSGL